MNLSYVSDAKDDVLYIPKDRDNRTAVAGVTIRPQCRILYNMLNFI